MQDIIIVHDVFYFMHTVRIPKVINFGEDALGQTEYPKNALVVTTVPPELSDKWIRKNGNSGLHVV